MLSDRGLNAALKALAAKAPFPVAVDSELDDRLPDSTEAAAYFVAAEALTNAIKHAHAQSAAISVTRGDELLRVEISDDGRGNADPSKGSGLRGLSDRVAALDGELRVESAAGGGTPRGQEFLLVPA